MGLTPVLVLYSPAKCYKTFNLNNLKFFKYIIVFVPCKPRQTSLMFVSKAPVYPSEGGAPGTVLTTLHFFVTYECAKVFVIGKPFQPVTL
jgi:hypothetical protein